MNFLHPRENDPLSLLGLLQIRIEALGRQSIATVIIILIQTQLITSHRPHRRRRREVILTNEPSPTPTTTTQVTLTTVPTILIFPHIAPTPRPRRTLTQQTQNTRIRGRALAAAPNISHNMARESRRTPATTASAADVNIVDKGWTRVCVC